MRASLVCLAILLLPALAAADAIPGDDECPPGQHWEGGHDGECSCAVSPGQPGSELVVLASLTAALVWTRRRLPR